MSPCWIILHAHLTWLLVIFSVPQAQGGHQGSLFSRYGSHQEGRDNKIETYPRRFHPGVHEGMAEQNTLKEKTCSLYRFLAKKLFVTPVLELF